jgi:glyoxylase-like metal-dependent hydrolase (beta-lactamase superfamily II)
MHVGKFEVHSIDAGRFALDGGAMFGVVPRPLWQMHASPDERNRVAMATRCLLVRGDGRTILIDTGNGTKLPDKLREIYRMTGGPTALDDALGVHGVRPTDVTDVILTHLHFDHAGGATRRDGNEVVPAFPRARYYVQKAHWDAALRPTDRDRASFFPDDFQPLEREGVLELLDGPGELFPGITMNISHGHTYAMQCPSISDAGRTVMFCADLIPMAPHVQLPWIMGYDLRPLETLEEKRRLLERAAEEAWVLALEHDPTRDGVIVGRGGKGFMVKQTVRLDDND